MNQSATKSYAIAPGCLGSRKDMGVCSSYDLEKTVAWGILKLSTLSRQILRALSTIAGEWEVVERYIVKRILSSWWLSDILDHMIFWR